MNTNTNPATDFFAIENDYLGMFAVTGVKRGRCIVQHTDAGRTGCSSCNKTAWGLAYCDAWGVALEICIDEADRMCERHFRSGKAEPTIVLCSWDTIEDYYNGGPIEFVPSWAFAYVDNGGQK